MTRKPTTALRSLVGSPIAFNKIYMHITRSASSAIMLSQMVYWQDRLSPEYAGWFYKTQKEWFEETALSDESQVTARRALCKLEILKEERRGPRRQLWFKIDMDILLSLVQDELDKQAERESQSPGTSGSESPGTSGSESPGTSGSESPGTSDTRVREPRGLVLTETTNKDYTEKEQEPSRGKREVDSRHDVFRKVCEGYAKHKGVTFVWDGSEAKAMALLLKAAPDLTYEAFHTCLLNRSKSPGTPHGDRPRMWLPNIMRYQQGPLNEFNKTEEVNANKLGNRKADAANTALQRSQERARNELAEAENRLRAAGGGEGQAGELLLGPGRSDGRDSSGKLFPSSG